MDRKRKVVNIKYRDRLGKVTMTKVEMTVYKGLGIFPLNGGERFSITIPTGAFEGYGTLIVDKFTDAVILINFMSEECKHLIIDGNKDANKGLYAACKKAFDHYGIMASTK